MRCPRMILSRIRVNRLLESQYGSYLIGIESIFLWLDTKHLNLSHYSQVAMER